MSKKICVAVTARPSYSRIRSALTALKARPEIDLTVLCSGSALLSRFGRVADLIRADGFTVADELYTVVEGNEPINMALTLSNTIELSASAFRHLAPDVVVTIADRYETLGTAAAAAYLGIPLVHVQGGEVTGNIDEKVRHSVTKLSDFHLVATESARNRLIRMGEHPDTVVVTGCPSIDIAREAIETPFEDVQADIDSLGVGARLDLHEDYIVVMLHPETESYGNSFARTMATLDAIASIKMPTIMFWPNPDAGSDSVSKGIRVFRETHRDLEVNYQKNLEGHRFLRLLKNARCMIGNSSVGVRECAYLGTPVVNIGDRQHGRDRAANVIDVPWDKTAIEGAIRHQVAHGPYASSDLYGHGHAGVRIADALMRDLRPEAKRFYD
ncbi:UDP-N-acetylglucosamine 2-epimerase [Rhizobium sp. AG855]|uniref:UDP-N-acetylglucosamine 2-epimerase n=1 Tax=Rhizobium sp. AG855 TaxID=2183898 RepID=UPI000E757B3B|nr:UDP-N-acetylglucosamine 2-epimerase [Rhizobium sp. AG855]RKE85544.1 UDP-hydrolysing UDP-N-acetyl-D-glucosamine 2-epimerase [Rhizobium sp. AG855]